MGVDTVLSTGSLLLASDRTSGVNSAYILILPFLFKVFSRK